MWFEFNQPQHDHHRFPVVQEQRAPRARVRAEVHVLSFVREAWDFNRRGGAGPPPHSCWGGRHLRGRKFPQPETAPCPRNSVLRAAVLQSCSMYSFLSMEAVCKNCGAANPGCSRLSAGSFGAPTLVNGSKKPPERRLRARLPAPQSGIAASKAPSPEGETT